MTDTVNHEGLLLTAHNYTFEVTVWKGLQCKLGTCQLATEHLPQPNRPLELQLSKEGSF